MRNSVSEQIDSIPGSKKRFKSIDFVKGIAMLMVILVHYEQMFNITGFFACLQQGCAIFFVASGFGITSLINNKYGGSLRKDDVSKFYLSRVKALYPGWLLAFLLVFVSNSITLRFLNSPLNFGQNRGILSIICNLLFLNGLLPFCNNNVMPGGWYIGTTVVLYVITPIVFNALKKFKSKTVFLILTSVLSVGIWAIFYIFLGKRFDISKGFSEHIFFVQYPCYLSGIILYEIVNRKEAKSKHSVFIFVAGLILTVVSLGLYYIPYFYGYYLSIWSMSAGICMVVYYCALAENNMKFFDSIIGKTVIAFGKKSYNIYLTHAFVVYIFIFAVEKVVNRVGFSIKNTIGFLIFIPIVILLSYLLGNLFGKVVNLFNKLWSKLPFGF